MRKKRYALFFSVPDEIFPNNIILSVSYPLSHTTSPPYLSAVLILSIKYVRVFPLPDVSSILYDDVMRYTLLIFSCSSTYVSIQFLRLSSSEVCSNFCTIFHISGSSRTSFRSFSHSSRKKEMAEHSEAERRSWFFCCISTR